MVDEKLYKKFGYRYFGPLLLAFSKWINDDLQRNGIKRVYFLSRDGYIMKRAFDLIKSEEIESYYFYASRRAVIVPYLWRLKRKEEIFDVIKFNKTLTIKAFIKKVGLEEYNLTEYLKKYNYTLNSKIEIGNLGNFENVLSEIFELIQENSKKEWEQLQLYSKANKFDGKVAIVDIGWFGTMQSSLEKMFDENDITGYYFGLTPESDRNIKAKGFLFDKNKNIDTYNKLHYFINIFEFLFLAQHGSVKKYILNGDDVELYPYEYDKSREKFIAQDIQEFAIKYIEENKDIKINSDKIIIKFINFFLHPNYKAAVLFGNIKFNDDELKYIAKPQKIIRYLLHPKIFKQDFINSSWRIGFLKRIVFFPFPNYCINNLIRKIYLKDKE